MKFTKEEALEKLKGYLTNSGKKPLRMSERSLEGHIDDLMSLIANDETELDDFFEKAKGFVERANSNAEKDRSDFIKEWKRENPAAAKKDGQQPDEPDKGNGNDAMSEMLKRLEELERKNAARDMETKISAKRDELLKAMKEKGIKDEQWSKDLVSEISLTEDLDVAAKADSFLKLYNRQKAATPQGWTPGSPSGTSDSKNLFDDVKKLKKQRDEAQKKVV